MDAPVRLKILIVDDDQLVRDFAVHTVQFHTNRKVTTFESGFEAWQYIRRHPGDVDIVIADANIPDMDGLELLALVKQQLPQCRFIVTAGDFGTEQRSCELGADAFLAKPYDAHDLLRVLQELVLAATAPQASGTIAFAAQNRRKVNPTAA